MPWKKLYQWVLAAVCALLFALLAAAFIRLYREGAALRAAGDAAASIFTREKLTERLAPLLPLAILAAGLIVAAAPLGIGSGASGFGRIPPRRTTSGRTEVDPGDKFDVLRSKACDPARKHRIALLRAALAAVALMLIIAGIYNGSMKDVLYKAINICTECVGLG